MHCVHHFHCGWGYSIPPPPTVSGAKPKFACANKWLEPALLAQTIYIPYGLIESFSINRVFLEISKSVAAVRKACATGSRQKVTDQPRRCLKMLPAAKSPRTQKHFNSSMLEASKLVACS